MAQYHAGPTSFPPAPGMRSMPPQHHGEQKDQRLSYKTYVGNDRHIAEEAELQEDWVAWPPWAFASASSSRRWCHVTSRWPSVKVAKDANLLNTTPQEGAERGSKFSQGGEFSGLGPALMGHQ